MYAGLEIQVPDPRARLIHRRPVAGVTVVEPSMAGAPADDVPRTTDQRSGVPVPQDAGRYTSVTPVRASSPAGSTIRIDPRPT